jgi:uncharacterized protein YegL
MNQTYTDITIILDRSGSMESIKDSTIAAFNKFLEEQRKLPGQVRFSLVQFDHQYDVIYSNLDLVEVPDLNGTSYKTRGGHTALLDAMGRTIDDIGKRLAAMPTSERPHQVLVATITDGEENASRNYKLHDVFDKVRHQEDVYSWQFVLLGANQDTIANAAKLGMTGNSGINYVASNTGIMRGITTFSDTVGQYRMSGVGKMKDFAGAQV